MTDEESRKAIIRYDPGPATYTCGDYWSDMQISVDGDYVLYTDHIAAVELAAKRERERCIDAVNAYSLVYDRSEQMLAEIRGG